MKSLITKILISVFILFISISFLVLNSNQNNIINSIEEEKETQRQSTYLYIYDITVIIFLIILLIYISYNGCVRGTIKSLFIWAFFASCTPVPEAGLLFSLPLKRYFNIPMHICQAFVSLLALCMLYYFYLCENKTIKTYMIGKLFLELIAFKYFSIIIFSIISSILTSQLIDNFINHYIYKDKINYLYTKISIIVVFIIIYLYLLNSLINKIK